MQIFESTNARLSNLVEMQSKVTEMQKKGLFW